MRSPTPFVAALATLLAASAVLAQSSPIRSEFRPSRVDSGEFDNPTTRAVVVYSKLIEVPGAEWLRLTVDDASLPGDSYIEVAALVDGYNMRLDAPTLEQWRSQSAYFNGNALLVRLVAGPNTEGVHFSTRRIEVGLPPLQGPTTICGPTDDRTPSTDKRAGRVMSVGCSAWLINGTNCFISAGHCCASSRHTVVQFNVPPSSANGSPRNPPPADQFPVDVASKKFVNGGVGNDWCVFQTRTNSNGQHAGQRQGAFFRLATTNPGVGSPIRITGYGVTSPRNSRSQTQQTHSGPLRFVTGSRLCYHTDTTGGNSGSPVIDSAGLATGVHTHGGCGSSTSSCNTGTSVLNTAFANAIRTSCGGGTPGVYTFYGTGCKGTGGGGNVCVSLNPAGGTLSGQNLPNEYCYPARATQQITVVAFELYTRARSAATSMTCGIYLRANATTPSTTAAATGTMQVGTSAGFYRVTLNRPVTITPGLFWISQHDTSTVLPADLTSGSPPPGIIYWRRPPGSGSWLRTGILRTPSYRVICTGGGGNSIPLLSVNDVPNVGRAFTLTVALAKPSAPMFFLFGGAQSNIDLGPFGAPTCAVLARPDILIGSTTNSGGSASLRVNIPNDKSLFKGVFYNQATIRDSAANTLGIAVSRGGRGTIGNN